METVLVTSQHYKCPSVVWKCLVKDQTVSIPRPYWTYQKIDLYIEYRSLVHTMDAKIIG